MNKKRLFSLILAIVMVCLPTAQVFGATFALPDTPPVISPQYVAADTILPKVSYSNGTITGSVTVITYENCRVEIDMDILKSRNGTSWEIEADRPVKVIYSGTVRSTSYPINNADTGYKYKVYTRVKIYMNNSLVDDIEMYSSVVSI